MTNSVRRRRRRCQLTTIPDSAGNHAIPQAAINVTDHLAKYGSVIYKEDRETACRHYRLTKELTDSATSKDTPGSSDEFARMISEAAGDDSPFDVIVIWKLNRFFISLEDTIEYGARLRQAGTRLVSTTERWIDD